MIIVTHTEKDTHARIPHNVDFTFTSTLTQIALFFLRSILLWVENHVYTYNPNDIINKCTSTTFELNCKRVREGERDFLEPRSYDEYLHFSVVAKTLLIFFSSSSSSLHLSIIPVGCISVCCLHECLVFYSIFIFKLTFSWQL